MNREYDFLIIGGGAAGYSAAFKAVSQMRVAIIEKGDIGGVCLNRGCIPTKKMRWIASRYGRNNLKTSLPYHGEQKQLLIDDKSIENGVREAVDDLRNGLVSSMRNAGIDVYYGNAHSARADNQEIIVEERNGSEVVLKYKWLLIAAGSQPVVPQIYNPLFNSKITGNSIFTSDSAFHVENVLPESILIVGGGVIGVEFASIYSDLGVKVIIIEQQDRIISKFSKDVSRTAARILRSKGVQVLTGYRVADVFEEDEEAVVTIESAEGNTGKEEILVNKILVSVGRESVMNQGLLDDLGVKYEHKKICVNEHNETSNKQVYAAGDVCNEIQLAYVASYQGEQVAERIMNMSSNGDSNSIEAGCRIDEMVIPSCVFIDPEIVQIGVNEDHIDKLYKTYAVSKYSLKGNGMAVLQDNKNGYVKLIVEKESGIVVGAELVCPDAVEMAALCKTWIDRKITAFEIAHEVFPHPSISESLREAAKMLI